MKHCILSTAWFLVFVSLSDPSRAAEPEFKVWLVTESRTYERPEQVVPAASIGMPVFTGLQSINRVTVELEGTRVSGEWELEASRVRAEDFPLGANIEVATRRNQLLLKRPDGKVVRARIVDRKENGEDEK